MEVLAYANATARDAALPSPKRGQPVFMLDSGDFLLWYGSPLGWAAPWGAAWGRIDTAQIASLSGPFADGNYGTDLGLSITFTPVKNRAYEVVLEGVTYSPGVSLVEYFIRPQHTGDTSASWGRGWDLSPGDGKPFRIARYYEEGTDPIHGSKPVTFDAAYLSLQITGVGAGTEPKVPTRLYVDDVGPIGPAPVTA